MPRMPHSRGQIGHRCRPIGLGFYMSMVALAGAEEAPPADAAPAEGGAAAPAVEVRIEDGRLTLQVDGAALGEVLRAIGEAGAFRVVLRGAFATPVHESFTQRPLEEAIRRLVGDHPLVMTRGHPDPADGARDLAEIRVIEQGAPTQSGGYVAAEVANALSQEEPTSSSFEAELPWHPILSLEGAPTRDDILSALVDQDQAVRIAAVPLVGSLRPHEAVQVLAHAFASEGDMLVRSRGVAALTRLQAPGAAALLRQRALRDEDPELRMQALNALAASSGRTSAVSAERRITPVLGQALRSDPEPRVRITAIRALQRIGGASARSYLQQAATDPDPAIANAAEQAISQGEAD